MAYVDYEYYTNTYHGSAIGADAFPRLSERASRYIDTATLNRAKSASGDRLKAVQNAACALAEIMQDEERMNQAAYSTDRPVASETVGGWSRTFGAKSVSGTDVNLIDSRKQETLLIYLGNTGLLQMRGYYR